jgi:cytoskeletal protein CcmA (bactofilin family)
MPSVPDPEHVKPWYLRNITEALALDEASGNVYVRTGFTGNIVIEGNINLPGNVNANVYRFGNIDISGNTLPVTFDNTTIEVTQGTDPWNISGNINIDTMPAITGNVTVSGNVNIDNMPAITGNVEANVTAFGNIDITGNTLPVTFDNTTISVSGSVEANVTAFGNIDITGNTLPVTFDNTTIEVTQGTDPWNVTGNVTTTPALGTGDFFGEPYAIPITPVVQTDGRYGIYNLDHQTYIGSGGNVSCSGSTFNLTPSTTTGSYALIRTRRFNTFKPGQSLIARFYAKFDTPVAGMRQLLGLNNQENSYWFGYDGVNFGFQHVYGGRADIHRITVNSYTGSQTITVTLNGVQYTGTISAALSTDQVAYQISRFNFGSGWLANQRDNTVELLSTGNSPLNGTFSVSGSGTFSGSIAQVQAGVANSNEWEYAGTGDFPALPSWYYPERYNQYQIKYGWAGVRIFIMNPATGQFEVLYDHSHAEYTDGNTLRLINPAFKIAAQILNTGGSTPATMRVASMMTGLEGITNRNNYSAAESVIQTTLTQNDVHHLISIQNPYTFNNTINTIETLLQDLSVTMQCNDPTQVYIYLDAALLTGIHDFKSIDGRPATVSKVIGTIDPAVNYPIASFIVGLTGATTQFALESYRIVVPPGATLTLAITSTATIQKAGAAIVWYND